LPRCRTLEVSHMLFVSLWYIDIGDTCRKLPVLSFYYKVVIFAVQVIQALLVSLHSISHEV
jgi:hypothetical protein